MFIYLLPLIFVLQSINQPALAISTPTPTLPIEEITPTPPSSLDEIQKIREVVQQKVKEKLKEITSVSSPKKGFVGKIILLDNSQITIENQSDTKTIKIDSDTIFIDTKRNKTKIDSLKVGQDVLILGLVDESGVMLAKRVVVSDLTQLNTPRVAVIGKVIDISKTTSVFSLVPSKNKSTQYQIKTDSKTIITDSKGEKITLSSLSTGQKIITVLNPDTKLTKTYYASRIINLDYSPSPTPTKK